MHHMRKCISMKFLYQFPLPKINIAFLGGWVGGVGGVGSALGEEGDGVGMGGRGQMRHQLHRSSNYFYFK